MTILVKKVFISSKPTFVYLLCPPLCGPFSIQESAAGGLSYKAKKAANLFKIYCLCAAVMGGGIKLLAVFQMEFICNRFLFAFQFLFCNLP